MTRPSRKAALRQSPIRSHFMFQRDTHDLVFMKVLKILGVQSKSLGASSLTPESPKGLCSQCNEQRPGGANVEAVRQPTLQAMVPDPDYTSRHQRSGTLKPPTGRCWHGWCLDTWVPRHDGIEQRSQRGRLDDCAWRLENRCLCLSTLKIMSKQPLIGMVLIKSKHRA